MELPVFETDFPDLVLLKRGKVRDIYDLGDKLLLVATDRISAFDVVMPNPIPQKGKILTQISLFWLDIMKPIAVNHLITSDVNQYPEECHPYSDILKGRSMLVRKTQPLPVECVVRGYLSGSGWNAYLETGEICGIKLPDGLKESDRLPEPIFTPSTKEEIGIHDINIDFNEVVRLIGPARSQQIKELSIRIYQKGAEYAAEKGIIIADTKFEFGIDGDRLILIDEILTPDSSRFWPKKSYQPGGPQLSYDKQYLRDYLISIKWNKTPPAPNLPLEVVENTRLKYMEALGSLTDIRHAI
ncbi:MAG: phosphoribosylaminoimidazolesuccinocarboxamide synthase [Desulfobacterales bacterium]|jgi:phosphoribosylaminoimidazole-succinocarboxamide synthase|nr:phosphoribosylaminoimidazolesuccinocarboxamide synthase [Desulfobacterales bacterium]